jgi:hypothetical protein
LIDHYSAAFFDELSKIASNAEENALKTELLPHQKRVVDRIKERPALVVAHGVGFGGRGVRVQAAHSGKH